MIRSLLIGMGFVLVAGAVSGNDPRVATTNVNDVCSAGYARAHRDRDNDVALKRALLEARGLSLRDGYLYQADHTLPLCLGGADVPANLHLQPLIDAHKKDRLEWYACREVCSGEENLPWWQARFLEGKWRETYEMTFGENP